MKTVSFAAEDAGEDPIASEESADAVQIVLSEDQTEIFGEGASVSGNTITVTESGAYRFSGSLKDGQICVDAGKKDTVVLELAGVDLSNEKEPVIYVKNAGYTTILLAEGTVNRICSGTDTGKEAAEGKAEEDAQDGAVYARDDLGINGSGSLEVKGFINNGIHCTDNLTIAGGELKVDAVSHGIKGKDSLKVTGGTLTVMSGKDALHSEGAVSISDGSMVIQAGDDGIHADTDLIVTGGFMEIQQCYEGLEGNQVTIAGGEIRINASDDGINACGGTSAFGGWNAFWNTGKENTGEMPVLLITDGLIYVNAQGDGLDSNGDLLVEGGIVVVDGPANAANGAIDYGAENGGECSISGGTVLAVGAAGMAETFGSNSTQCSFSCTLQETHGAGSVIMITDEAGEILIKYTASKNFSSIVFSSPELELGAVCQVSVDGETAEITLDEISAGNSPWGSGFPGRMTDRPGGQEDFTGDFFGGRREEQPDEPAENPPDPAKDQAAPFF